MKFLNFSIGGLFQDFAYYFVLFSIGESNHDIKSSFLKIPRGLIGFGKADYHTIFKWEETRIFYFFTIFWFVFTTEKKEAKPKMMKVEEFEKLFSEYNKLREKNTEKRL